MKAILTAICLAIAASSFGAETNASNIAITEEPIRVMVLVAAETNAQGQLVAEIRNSETQTTRTITANAILHISGADYVITEIGSELVRARNVKTGRIIHISEKGCRIFNGGQYRNEEEKNGQPAGGESLLWFKEKLQKNDGTTLGQSPPAPRESRGIGGGIGVTSQNGGIGVTAA